MSNANVKEVAIIANAELLELAGKASAALSETEAKQDKGVQAQRLFDYFKQAENEEQFNALQDQLKSRHRKVSKLPISAYQRALTSTIKGAIKAGLFAEATSYNDAKQAYLSHKAEQAKQNGSKGKGGKGNQDAPEAAPMPKGIVGEAMQKLHKAVAEVTVSADIKVITAMAAEIEALADELAMLVPKAPQQEAA